MIVAPKPGEGGKPEIDQEIYALYPAFPRPRRAGGLTPEEIRIVEGTTSTKMSTGNKTNLKQVLRDECLPALGSQSKYYSVDTVKVWLNRRKLHSPASDAQPLFP